MASSWPPNAWQSVRLTELHSLVLSYSPFIRLRLAVRAIPPALWPANTRLSGWFQFDALALAGCPLPSLGTAGIKAADERRQTQIEDEVPFSVGLRSSAALIDVFTISDSFRYPYGFIDDNKVLLYF
jgi:hypothetical protein